MSIDFTRNERRRIRRVNVGRIDDGRYAFPVRRGFTEDMARAAFEAFDNELVMGEQLVVDWCPHTSDYQYRHDCADWCERPVSALVWTATYPTESSR